MTMNKKLLALAVSAAAGTFSASAFATITISDPDGSDTNSNAPRVAPGQTVSAENIQISSTDGAEDFAKIGTANATFYVDAPAGTVFSAAPTATVSVGNLFLDDNGLATKAKADLINDGKRAVWEVSSPGAAAAVQIDITGVSLTLGASESVTTVGTTAATALTKNDLKYNVAVMSGAPALDQDIVAAVKVASSAAQQALATNTNANTIVNPSVPATVAAGGADSKPAALLFTLPANAEAGKTITITAPTTVDFTGSAITVTQLNGSLGSVTIPAPVVAGNVLTFTLGGTGKTTSAAQVEVALDTFATNNATLGALSANFGGTAGISTQGVQFATAVQGGTKNTSATDPADVTRGATASQSVSTLTLTELFGDDIKAGTFEVTPPSGVTFDTAAVPTFNDTATGTAAIAVGTDFTSSKLKVTVGGAGAAPAGKIDIVGLKVKVADSYSATTIPLTITDGTAKVSNGTVVVADVKAPTTKVESAVVSPAVPVVVGIGSKGVTLDTLVLTEVEPASLQIPGTGGLGSIIVTPPAGFTITSATATPNLVNLVSNTGFVPDGGGSATFQVQGETAAAGSLSIVIKGNVASSVAPGTDLKFAVSGTAGATGDAVLGTVNVATKATGADLEDIQPSNTAQKVGKVTITENFATALSNAGTGTIRLVAPAGASFAASGHTITGGAFQNVVSSQNANDTLEIAITPTGAIDIITVVPNMFVTSSFPQDTVLSVQILDGDAAGTTGETVGVTSETVAIAFNGESTELAVGGNVDVAAGFSATTTVEGEGEITVSSSDDSIATASVADGIITVTGVSAGTATITVEDERTSTTFTAVVSAVDVEDDHEEATSVVARDGSTTDARIFVGASSDNGDSFGTEFTTGDDVQIVGTVQPDPDDVGEAGDLFVVVRTVDTDGNSLWFYRDVDGNFQAWDKRVDSLEPAVEVGTLEASHTVEVFAGNLIAGSHRVFLGYMTEDGPLVHNDVPVRIEVTE